MMSPESEFGFESELLNGWFSEMPPLAGVYAKFSVEPNDLSSIPFASVLEQTLFSGKRHCIFRMHINIQSLSLLWGSSPGIVGDLNDFYLEIGNRFANQWRHHYQLSRDVPVEGGGSLPRLIGFSEKSVTPSSFQLLHSCCFSLESEYALVKGKMEWMLSAESLEEDSDVSGLEMSPSLLDHFPLGVVILDSDFKVKAWNQWMIQHSTGSLSNGRFYKDDGGVLFARSCLLEGEEACTILHSAVANAIYAKQSSYFSHTLHRSILQLSAENGLRLYHNISVTPIPNGVMIQISDMTNLMERENLLRTQTEWLDKNLENSAANASFPSVKVNNHIDDLTG
ncbi:MAG TPA: hypothetical protein VIY47_09030, partial [Ignavibacteriaceae bacterium]